MSEQAHAGFIARAIELATVHSADGTHGPFGAVVVHGKTIVGEGFNSVVAEHDPTAHAEIIAIRQAAQRLQTHDLSACTLYASCEPCPMCLAAIYWARIPTVYYAATHADAHEAGFDDLNIYRRLCEKHGDTPWCIQLTHKDASVALKAWPTKPQRKIY